MAIEPFGGLHDALRQAAGVERLLPRRHGCVIDAYDAMRAFDPCRSDGSLGADLAAAACNVAAAPAAQLGPLAWGAGLLPCALAFALALAFAFVGALAA